MSILNADSPKFFFIYEFERGNTHFETLNRRKVHFDNGLSQAFIQKADLQGIYLWEVKWLF